MTEQSQYFLESYVPSHLTLDAGYVQAYKDRMAALMEMQEYNIDEIGEPFIRETPDCPAVPGMCVFRVEAVVREYDIEVPMDEDDPDEDNDAAWTQMPSTEFEESPPPDPVDDSTLALAAQIAKGITTRLSAED